MLHGVIITSYWLTGFQPVTSPGSVHHLLVAACSQPPPAPPHNVWNCGSGGKPELQPGYPALNTVRTLSTHSI